MRVVLSAVAAVAVLAFIVMALGGRGDADEFAAFVSARRALGPVPSATATGDLDGDGVAEAAVMEDGRLSLVAGSGTIWRSPEDWWVEAAAIGDVTGDGAVELSVSVWKQGDFGPSRPFWVAEEDTSVKNHLFVLAWREGGLRPLWQSSNLEAPNCEIAVGDVGGDGRPDLAVIEGDYADRPACIGRRVAVWRWNGWGFANERRGPAGRWKGLSIVGGTATAAGSPD